MSERPGFMMYHDAFHALEELDDASFKRVLCAICRYSEDGEISAELNAAERAIFGMFRGKLDADWKRYQRRVDAGTKGGVKSGEARRSNAKQNEATRSKTNDCEANRSNAKQTEANEPTITVPITVTPTITPTITIGNSSNSYARAGDGEEEIPPSAGEVEQYIREHGLGVDAQEFIDRCEAAGWRDGNGEPVTNWRLWLKGYAIRSARPQGGRAGRLGMDPRLAELEAMKGGRG